MGSENNNVTYQENKKKFTNSHFILLALGVFILALSFISQARNAEIYEMRTKKLQNNIENIQNELDSLSTVIDTLKTKTTISLRTKAEKLSGLEIPERFTEKEINLVFTEAKKYNIKPGKIFRLIQAESNFKHNAKSSAGAKGYMQMMDRTYKAYAKKLNITKHDKHSNIKVGIYYLVTWKNAWKKRGYTDKQAWKLALLSYNRGPSAVGKNVKGFLKREDSYVNKILGEFKV